VNVAVVSIATFSDLYKGFQVSDLSVKTRLSSLSRPLIMTAAMIGMALLGAAGSLVLQSTKLFTHEENPAADSVSPQSDAKTFQADAVLEDALATPAPQEGSAVSQHISNAHNTAPADASDHRQASDDPFSELALGFSNQQASSATPSQLWLSDDTDDETEAAGERRSEKMSIDETRGHNVAPAGSLVNEDKSTQQTVNLMSIADEQLASGSYVQAMHAYQSIRQKSQGSPGAAILIRLALCAEAAGRRAAALEAYRKVTVIQSDPAWAGVARYGEARCLAAVKRHDGLQSDLLRRVLLDESEFLPTVRNEVMHLIGRDLWQEQSPTTTVDLLDDKSFVVPEWTADPARLLSEFPLLIHETPAKIGPIKFEVLHEDRHTPDGISVLLSCGTTRLERLLNDLVSACRLKCDISPQAIRQLQGRTQQIHVNDSTLAVLLDGMTIPYDLCWQLRNDAVVITHSGEASVDELRQCRLNSAERILRVAVTNGPVSRQAGHSRLALAALLYEQQRAADAVQFLQIQIETEPRSVVETEAAFNLGKCLMALNQRNEAREAFLRSIDAAGGQAEVKIAAYVFTSRLLLEDNQGKLCISNMMRGVSLSEDSPMGLYAALQLASAYLVFGDPQGANSVLMERRDELANGPGREAAAFVSALARFRAAVLADRREREGWAVVAALSEFKPDKYCGGHWAVLVAEACDELGLTEQATDAYSLALRKLPPSWLRDRTVLRLASRYQEDHDFEEARLLLVTLTTTEADQLALQAKLRSAEVSLQQNRPEEAIQTCRLLIDSTDTPQLERAALRIMGQAYEQQKNHQAAIYCFAGMMPDENRKERKDDSPVVPAEKKRGSR